MNEQINEIENPETEWSTYRNLIYKINTVSQIIGGNEFLISGLERTGES